MRPFKKVDDLVRGAGPARALREILQPFSVEFTVAIGCQKKLVGVLPVALLPQLASTLKWGITVKLTAIDHGARHRPGEL